MPFVALIYNHKRTSRGVRGGNCPQNIKKTKTGKIGQKMYFSGKIYLKQVTFSCKIFFDRPKSVRSAHPHAKFFILQFKII